MKTRYFFIFLLVSSSLFAYNKTNGTGLREGADNNERDSTLKNNTMTIKIGSKTFTATLEENETAIAFKALLPLTLKMDDINNNEKKYDFPKSLPGKSINPGTINSGDLMIWSGNTLVLFYKTFPTQYSYAKLGRVDDPSALAAALGAGSVTVEYKLNY